MIFSGFVTFGAIEKPKPLGFNFKTDKSKQKKIHSHLAFDSIVLFTQWLVGVGGCIVNLNGRICLLDCEI